MGVAAILVLPLSAPVAAVPTDVGYRDFSYGSSVSAPTGQKPQSKLWVADGKWWGALYSTSARAFTIHVLDWGTQEWSDTGVELDTRSSAQLDALWDGTALYTVGAGTGSDSADSAQLRRFSYMPSGGYVMDPGFPVTVVDGGMEAGVFDKDTTGTLWFTYTRSNAAYVTHTTTNDQTWATPYVIPVDGADTLSSDDISAVVAYDGKIGVMWSNQNDSTMYFAIHVDGAAPDQWTVNPAVQMPEYADDHMNLKSLQADADGRVYAATKTSLNASGAPLMLLLVLDGNGSWQRHTVATVAENHTRPLVLIDQENRQLYWFASSPCCSGGTIYYKQTSLDNIDFAPGLGTPFIESGIDLNVNNITSTKQALDSSTGLVAIASDDHTRYYLHNAFTLGAPSGPPETTITSGPSGDVAVDSATFSFVSSIPGSTFECSLDGAPAASCTSPATYSGLSLGAHTFDVAARDPAGEVDPSPAHAGWNVVSPGDVVSELDIRITSTTDDAEEWQNGEVNLDSSDLELVDDSGRGNQAVGLRFPALTVPAGSTISDAWIQFQVDEASTATASLVIEGDATDDAAAFTATTGSIRARPRTGSSVAWGPPGWPTVGAAGAEQRTPPLVSILQELIDRPGWTSGNAAAFIITGSGTRWAEAYDGDPSGAPLLHVAYSGAPPAPPMISAISPAIGPPGTLVTIDGSDLAGATAVAFNGTPAPYTVVSSAQLTATVPGTATSGPVSVTTAGGTAYGADFTITDPEPSAAIRVPADQPTIQAAIDAAVDDDVIIVAPGTYHESVTISGKTITLASRFYESGDPSAIESTVIDTDGSQDAITIQNTTGAGPSIVGLKLVKGTTDIVDGIRVEGSARLLNLHIVGFDDGVDLDPLGGALSICECRYNLIELGTDDGFDLDGAAGGVFAQNILRNNHEDGIEVRLSDTSTPVNIQILDNELSGNGQDGIQIIDLPGLSDRTFTIDRNLFVDNGRAGIGLMDNGQSGEDYRAASLLDRINLFNNTFSGNDHALSGGDNIIGLNNIFAGSSSIGAKGVDGSSLLAYSTFWDNGTDAASSNIDPATTQYADPLLGTDYSLGSGSPAIDAGVASYTFGGETVLDLPPSAYSGSAPDHGARESAGTGGLASPEILEPTTGVTVTTRTFTVRGSAPGASRVRLLVDGTERSSTAVGANDGWATVVNGLVDGSHVIAAVAVDASSSESAPSADLPITVTLVPSDFTIAAAGDIACDRVGTTDCQQMATSDLLLDGAYDAVLPLGDTQYECGSATEFALGYDPSWGRLKPITRPSVGNHEYFTDRGTDCDLSGTASGYFDYFGSAAGTLGEGWYSYDLGGWHLIALNSNCDKVGGCDVGSPQEQWLKADLEASAASCTVAYWHTPRWSSGSVHGGDSSTQALVEALYDGGAELVLSGHEHNYERFAPQRPDGTLDTDYGLRQMVIGTGGRSLYPFGTPVPNSEVRLDTAFGVVSLTLGSGTYSWDFISTTGTTLDSGSGTCHDAPAGDTTPPDTTITSGPDDPSTSADAAFTFSATEPGSTFACALDGAAFTACTSPQSYPGLADGPHTFAVRATDAAANTDPTPASWSWTIDTTAPTVTDTSPADGATEVATDALATATFDEAMDAATLSDTTVGLSLGGAPVSSAVTYDGPSRTVTLTPPVALDSGATYTVTIDGATDLAGNALTPYSWTFTTAAGDTTPPDTTITSGPDDPSTSADAAFTFSATEPGSTFACALDGAAFTACTSPQSYPGLADGPHTFAVRATDAAANTDPTPASWSWTIDTTAPTVTDTSPADGATEVATDALATATFDEAMDAATLSDTTVGLSLGGAPVSSAVTYDGPSRTVTLTPPVALDSGATYTVTIDGATDLAGNALTPYSWTFTTAAGDTTPPDTTITSGPDDPSTSADAAFTFSATEPGSTFACALDGAAFTACTSPQSYPGLADGPHTFAVRATDAAANTDPTPASWSWTIDTTAPTVTDTSPADGATEVATDALATATFDEAMDAATLSDTTVGLSLGGAPVSSAVTYDGPSRTVTLTPPVALDSGATYTVTIDGATDLAGNALTPYSWTFTTAAGDTTPPDTTITSGPDDPSTSADAAFTFSATEPGSTFACALDGAAFTACTSPQSYPGLADGPHTFAVRATDAAANTDPTPASWSWTIDTTAPTVTDTSPADGATEVATDALATATFDEAMDAATLSDTTVGLSLGGAPVSSAVTYDGPSRTVTLTPPVALDSGATYTVTIDGATDLAGNALTPYSWTFTTAAGDTTPPDTTITSGPDDPSTSADAAFTFSATEPGSTFACALDGAAFTACTSPQSYPGLADGPHTFAVRATDAAANTDPTPASWSWTIDTTAPTAPVTVAFTPTADAHVREAAPDESYGTSPTLLADASDNRGVTEANLRFTVSGVSAVQQALLRIWVTGKTNGGPSVYMSDANWDESVSWTTRPTVTGSAVATAGVIATGWYEYDVTTAVSGNGTISFTLVPTSPDGLDFSSREGTERPQLEITYLGTDETPPQTTIQSGPTGLTDSNSATFTFVSSELDSTFACSLDGAAYETCASPHSYTALANGDHIFAVRATDAVGNTDATPATQSWTVLTASAASFVASADTLVDERRDTTNFGTATTLESDGDNGRSKQSYLGFEVAGIGTPIVSATIRIWVTNSTGNGPEVYVTDSAWDETSLTWVTRPSLAPSPITDAGSIASGDWYEFDVTSAIDGDGSYSFAMVSTSTDALKFASRETDTPPELVIDYGS